MDVQGFHNQLRERKFSEHDLCPRCKKKKTELPTKNGEVMLYGRHHSDNGCTRKCKLPQCFRCGGDIAFYCNTCKRDMCLQCKERHVTHYLTKFHQVVLYKACKCKVPMYKEAFTKQCGPQCQEDTEFYCYACKHNPCLHCRMGHLGNFLIEHHKVALYETFTKKCKIRQCSQCQGDTEFYCNTCKQGLCLQCKERHVIDLDTIDHDVVIYREKFENISREEIRLRELKTPYSKCCKSCGMCLLYQCRRREIQDKVISEFIYIEKRYRYDIFIHNVKSEKLYNSCSLLAQIKTDMKTLQTEISNRQSNVSALYETVKNRAICDLTIRYSSYIRQRLQQQKKLMNIHLARVEHYESNYIQSTNRPVNFLLKFKKKGVSKNKKTCKLPKYALLSLTENISMEDVIKILNEILFMETTKRHICIAYQLEMLSKPVLTKLLIATGVTEVDYISVMKSDLLWVSDHFSIILTNTEGNELHCLTDCGNRAHTVNNTLDLIYIDKNDNINKLSHNNRIESTLITKTGPWIPRFVYFSPYSKTLLVGMLNTDTWTGKITRYDHEGQYIQTIQHGNTGQELYSDPAYITENSNRDIIVSDWDRGAVVVTDSTGRHRFSYTGPPSGSPLAPRGICTDVLSHILVCDANTNTVQMIDKDGNFLSVILTQQHGIHRPWCLGYDNKKHLLWVGSLNDNRVFAYRYINRHDYLTGTCKE